VLCALRCVLVFVQIYLPQLRAAFRSTCCVPAMLTCVLPLYCHVYCLQVLQSQLPSGTLAGTQACLLAAVNGGSSSSSSSSSRDTCSHSHRSDRASRGVLNYGRSNKASSIQQHASSAGRYLYAPVAASYSGPKCTTVAIG
jgi:hypothetical protein